MREILINYTKYNFWANQKIADLLKPLSQEQIEKELGGSFPSIQSTVYHIWMAEYVWLERLKMTEKIAIPAENFAGTFTEACEMWLQTSQNIFDFVAKQKDDKIFHHEFLYHNIKKEPFKNMVWECLHHCMNHSTFHRGQIINYLRMIGITKIPSTDMITYQRLKK